MMRKAQALVACMFGALCALVWLCEVLDQSKGAPSEG